MQRPAVRSIMLATLLVAVPPQSARAELLDAVNWARQQGCPARAREPLRQSPQLQVAAQRLAGGDSLHAALAAADYRAERSSALVISGAGSNWALRRLLAAHYCATLTDPRLTELGLQRRGGDAWVVLASRRALPASSDAAVIDRQILDLVNRARVRGRRCGAKVYGAVPPLEENGALSSAALAHSHEMAEYGRFEHTGRDGSTPGSRVERAGYGRYLIVGENIAAGAMTSAEVTEGWLDSPPHCENIMDPRFTQIGIAFAVNPRSPQLVYWTQDFAVPRRR